MGRRSFTKPSSVLHTCLIALVDAQNGAHTSMTLLSVRAAVPIDTACRSTWISTRSCGSAAMSSDQRKSVDADSMWVRCPFTGQLTLIQVGRPSKRGDGKVTSCERFLEGALCCAAECSWFAIPHYCKLHSTVFRSSAGRETLVPPTKTARKRPDPLLQEED